MKLLTIIYDAAVERSLMGLLEELEVRTWTKFDGAQGKGESGQKLNTAIWPGTNNQVIVAADEGSLLLIAENIRALQAEFKLKPGIFMYIQDIQPV